MQINGYNLNLNSNIIKLLNHYQPFYYPSINNVFKCFYLTPFNEVKVVLLGQDPYPNINDACGLSFSVNRNTNLPKSLVNIFKALQIDLNITRTNGDLTSWAQQGVLLLNTYLTYNAHDKLAHQNIGWEAITDDIIIQLSQRQKVIFVLLGNKAIQKQHLIDPLHNTIITAPHPSPLSCYRGFFQQHIFTKINHALINYHYPMIDWAK